MASVDDQNNESICVSIQVKLKNIFMLDVSQIVY